MQILCDEDRYVTSFALVGNLTEGIEVAEPEDIGHFREHFHSYRLNDDELVFEADREAILAADAKAETIRQLRDAECFPVINRGQFWYEMLTDTQKEELKTWYQAWLDATDTGAIPEKPAWL